MTCRGQCSGPATPRSILRFTQIPFRRPGPFQFILAFHDPNRCPDVKAAEDELAKTSLRDVAKLRPTRTVTEAVRLVYAARQSGKRDAAKKFGNYVLAYGKPLDWT